MYGEMAKLLCLICVFRVAFALSLGEDPTTTAKSAWHRKGSQDIPADDTTTTAATDFDENSDAVRPRLATPCLSPNGDPGYCVEIQKCQLLLEQLNNNEAVKFLRASRCGPSNEDPHRPKVCCGKYDNYRDTTTNPKPKDPLPKKCGNQNVTTKGRIFGGSEAELGEFPWMARLIHKNRNHFKTFGCSGFLIQSKFVMTAAHCLESEYIAKMGPVFEVQLGEHNIEKEIDCDSDGQCADHPVRIRVMENIIHPKYNKDSKQHHYDIGLVYLKKGAKMSEYIQPICLLEESVALTEYWISGWGKTQTDFASPVKMKLSLPMFNFDECVNLYNSIDLKVLRSQVCAGGEQNKDSCSGDSGGPLMILKAGNQWFANGIVSYGLGCGKAGWPGVYTSVPSYIEWIKRQMVKRITAKARQPKIPS